MFRITNLKHSKYHRDLLRMQDTVMDVIQKNTSHEINSYIPIIHNTRSEFIAASYYTEITSTGRVHYVTLGSLVYFVGVVLFLHEFYEISLKISIDEHYSYIHLPFDYLYHDHAVLGCYCTSHYFYVSI